MKNIYEKIKNNAPTWNKNVGLLDAQVRVIFGAILLTLAPLQALGIIQIPILSTIGATFAGVVIDIEGLINRCILFSILGINRCPADIKTNNK